MADREIGDRIAAYIGAEERGVSAETIARQFLRLTKPSGAAAMRLVRAVLASDSRFVEIGEGTWGLVPPGEDRLSLRGSCVTRRGLLSDPTTGGGAPT